MKVVGAIIKNNKGEYLLQKRTQDAPSFPSCWTLFGGIVEENESFDQAILRELKEEIGLAENKIIDIKRIQRNINKDNVEQIIFLISTDVSLNELSLNEGEKMEYVNHKKLFDRDFAFNIKEVLLEYLK